MFKRALDFFMARLPTDMVPYWDMIFSDGDDEPRDSSSTAIVACGLLEMADIVGGDDAEKYRDIARRFVKSLAKNYAVKDPAVANGLVLHGTYSKKTPYNTCTPEGVDECVSWGRLLLSGSADAAFAQLVVLLVTRLGGMDNVRYLA